MILRTEESASTQITTADLWLLTLGHAISVVHASTYVALILGNLIEAKHVRLHWLGLANESTFLYIVHFVRGKDGIDCCLFLGENKTIRSIIR